MKKHTLLRHGKILWIRDPAEITDESLDRHTIEVGFCLTCEAYYYKPTGMNAQCVERWEDFTSLLTAATGYIIQNSVMV
jgi:hypothetical protein